MLSAFSFMNNPYQTLGVERNASTDEIKRAYRRLASQHHPDKGGDKTKFQEIQGAYDTLNDPQRRAAFDNPRSQFQNFGFQNNGPFDFQSVFDIFGTRFQQPHQPRTQQARMSLWITLNDVAQAGPKTISVGSHLGTQTVEIEIPAGIDDGDTVQYPGIGPGGMDLVITFRIHPNPRWERQGLNLISEQVVDVWDLILGCEVQVTDILNTTLSVSIPAGTQPGTMIRLKSRGLRNRSGQNGDWFMRVQTRIPKDIPEDLLGLIQAKYQK